ncbi:hypothetical protein G7Y89_g1829 [Cudoniella acicularis]|uniref:Myb-like domain-containing protein n=1 Tax=Cudoniella acicularis TaxID=354080 RepID=A0A8H4RW80_9HELO|nr:hypothetical protein G7Y89_g1829 [Cudoniella acicularis]
MPFSYRQTAPVQGQNSAAFWNGSGEGSQYSHQDFLPDGDAHNGFIDAFDTFPASRESQTGQIDNRSSISGSSQNQWSGDLTSTRNESQAMSRLSSQDSIGAHSQRGTHSTANMYDQSRSARMHSSLSQGSFHMSSSRSDVTGRSISPEDPALCTPTQQMDLPELEYPFLGDDLAGVHPMYHRNSTSSTDPHPNHVSLSGSSFPTYATAEDDSYGPFTVGSNSLVNQGPVSQESMMCHPGAVMDAALLWDNGGNYLDSQRSSPAAPDDIWAVGLSMMTTSSTNSPLDYSPSLEAISPRYVQDFPDLVELPPYTTGDRVTRKPMGPRQSKVQSDLAANSRQQRLLGTSETSDDSFKLMNRSSLEIDNTARDHPLYQNVSAQADGLYHCPWEGQASCQHKPEKLKCNYDKFVDSHLKPYRCKVLACENLHFSSTACLLRHEREAHAMHGHGDKPFLCTYDGCERGVPGNGFPRHWNLRDHMKRVHNDPGQAKSNASGSPPPSGNARGKKRKADEKLEAQTTEKISKRLNSPPVVVHQPQEPSLNERYQQDWQKLLNTVEQLRNPRDIHNLNLLHNMHDTIKMTRLYQSMTTSILGLRTKGIHSTAFPGIVISLVATVACRFTHDRHAVRYLGSKRVTILVSAKQPRTPYNIYARHPLPLKITIGQYLGFKIIVIINMIGFAVSLALPSEPIGFLSLSPILLGIWKLLEVVFPTEEEEEAEKLRIAKHVLRLVEKYINWVIPFLYMGLGIDITIKSNCYPWSIEHIDNQFLANPGKTIMAVVSAAVLLAAIGAMLWLKLRKRTQQLARQLHQRNKPLSTLHPNTWGVNGPPRSPNGAFGNGSDQETATAAANPHNTVAHSKVRSGTLQAKRKRVPWTLEENETILKMKEEGCPWEEIHAALPRRTPGAIQVQYSTKLKK